MPSDNMAEYMRRWTAARRLKAIEHLGGACFACGADQDLHFHHKDPAEKEYSIGRIWTHRWEKILAEVEKCKLLCGDCHRKEHKSQAPHGTAQRYWRGCRCTPCREANTAHNREYNRKRRLSVVTGNRADS